MGRDTTPRWVHRAQLPGAKLLIGLERCFFYAGTGTHVASPWEISDRATAVLAHEFYWAWTAGASPERAMQPAELVVRRGFPHRAIWSAIEVASGSQH